jgi:hypothetical protein
LWSASSVIPKQSISRSVTLLNGLNPPLKLEIALYDPDAEPLQARLRGVAALDCALLIIVAIPAALISTFLSTFRFAGS